MKLPEVNHLLDSLLKEINNPKDGFGRGLIATFRRMPIVPFYLPKDTNLFFTGLTALRLKKLESLMTLEQQAKTEQFINSWAKILPQFQNPKGRPTYNYWRPIPKGHWPNGIWIKYFNQYALADDLDDTLLPYALGLKNKSDFEQVVDLAHKHKNGANGRYNTSCLPDIQRFETFNTWFGVKTPPELDVCVIATAISVFRNKGFGNTSLVSEGERLIKTVIEKASYFRFAHLVAPHYSIPGVIFYFLTSLLAECDTPLKEMEPELVIDIQVRMAEKISPLERLLCTLSLWKLGYLATELDAKLYAPSIRETIQPMIVLHNDSKLWKRTLSKIPIFKIENVCPGLVKAFWIEYQLLLPEALKRLDVFEKERAPFNLKPFFKQD